MKSIEIDQLIKSFDKGALIDFWYTITEENVNAQTKGKGFEYLICKAFELEGATVKYPYTVPMKDGSSAMEQIDGVIYFENIQCLIECKNTVDEVNFEPISKLRSQLQRRPANAIGSIFTTSGFTSPALTLVEFISPQTILLWEKKEIDICLKDGIFIKSLQDKYRFCVENGITNYNIIR